MSGAAINPEQRMTTPPPLDHRNARLANSSFCDVDLSASRFDNVKRQRAVFDNTDLTGAARRNVCLANVAITDANLGGMTIDGVLVNDLWRAFRQRPSA